MRPPAWLEAVIADFGRASGLGSFALNDRGAAAMRFETGATLRFEYTGMELVVAVSIAKCDLRSLLALSHPEAPFPFRVRTGILSNSGEAILAIRLAERDVTLPKLNAAFNTLWRLAGEIGGAR